MGATHFLMKRLPKVATEMSLHVLERSPRLAALSLSVSVHFSFRYISDGAIDGTPWARR
jgi:hypothetical protein